MQGVDQIDQIRESYSVSRRSRRNWTRLFYFCLDAALIYAFTIFKLSKPIDYRKHLDFLLSVARDLSQAYVTNKSRKGRTSVNYLRK